MRRKEGAEIGRRPSGGGWERVTDGLSLPPIVLHGEGGVTEGEDARVLQVLAVERGEEQQRLRWLAPRLSRVGLGFSAMLSGFGVR